MISAYRSQRRGGKGVIGARTKEEDFIEHLFVANTHAYLLFLTDRGPLLLAQGARDRAGGAHGAGAGRSSTSSRDGRARSACRRWCRCKEFDDQHYLVCATRKGLIKKTVLSAYGNPRRAGINAVLLEEGDGLIEAIITDGTQDLILAKQQGQGDPLPRAARCGRWAAPPTA